MKKQEFMIKYNNIEVFFFAHGFKTAREHAEEFIERNRGRFQMKLYMLNRGYFGPTWSWRKTVGGAK